jgi:hypothetical protein
MTWKIMLEDSVRIPSASTWMVGAALSRKEVQATTGSFLAERNVPGQEQLGWAAAEVSAWRHDG